MIQVDSLGSMLASDDASRVRGIALLAQVWQLHSVSHACPRLVETVVSECRAKLAERTSATRGGKISANMRLRSACVA